MRFRPSTLPPTIFETFPRPVRNSISPAPFLKAATVPANPPAFHRRPVNTMSTSNTGNTPPSFGQYKIHSAVPPSVQSMTAQQSLLACSVLDLFTGYPSKRKLALWTDDASFHDPLTIATGRKQFEAQWYGLKTITSEIVLEHAEVVSLGNPIELKTKLKYKVKAVGKEQNIESKVLVHTTGEGDAQKITRVEDRWNGDVPSEGFFAKVSQSQLLFWIRDRVDADTTNSGDEKLKQRHCPDICEGSGFD